VERETSWVTHSVHSLSAFYVRHFLANYVDLFRCRLGCSCVSVSQGQCDALNLKDFWTLFVLYFVKVVFFEPSPVAAPSWTSEVLIVGSSPLSVMFMWLFYRSLIPSID